MPAKHLKEFLDRHNVKYVTMTHSTAYTALEIASLAHVRGKDLAKTVIVKIDSALAMAVLPASYHVDLESLKAAARKSTLCSRRKQTSQTGSQIARSAQNRPLEISTECPYS
jgi:Ala-tRNA(Pro) deacylase